MGGVSSYSSPQRSPDCSPHRSPHLNWQITKLSLYLANNADAQARAPRLHRSHLATAAIAAAVSAASLSAANPLSAATITAATFTAAAIPAVLRHQAPSRLTPSPYSLHLAP